MDHHLDNVDDYDFSMVTIIYLTFGILATHDVDAKFHFREEEYISQAVPTLG